METKATLDKLKCGTKGCKHDHSKLYINSKCHPGGPLRVLYHKAEGCLHLECAICDKPVSVIQLNQYQ
jgi:hypothetical protein